MNCKGDVQVLLEVRQFQFNEDKLKLPLKNIFKPERVFIFKPNDYCQESNSTSKVNGQRLVITATDLPVQWLLGKPIKDTPQCGFDNPDCIQEQISS